MNYDMQHYWHLPIESIFQNIFLQQHFLIQNAGIDQFVSSCYSLCSFLILSFSEAAIMEKHQNCFSTSALFDGKSFYRSPM